MKKQKDGEEAGGAKEWFRQDRRVASKALRR